MQDGAQARTVSVEVGQLRVGSARRADTGMSRGRGASTDLRSASGHRVESGKRTLALRAAAVNGSQGMLATVRQRLVGRRQAAGESLVGRGSLGRALQRRQGCLVVRGIGVVRRLSGVRGRRSSVAVRGLLVRVATLQRRQGTRSVGSRSVVAVGRSRGGRRRPSVAGLGVLRSIGLLVGMMLGSNHVGRLLHGSAGEGWSLVGLAHAGLGVHPLDGDDAAQRRVVGGLRQLGLAGLRARVVRDKVKVLVVGSGDAEGLLHETVGLVAVALGLAVVKILVAHAAVLAGATAGAKAAASLALHFAVGEEAAGDTAGAPGLAVGPSAHAGLALVPDEDGAGADGLALLFGETTLDAGQKAKTAGLEELDGIGGSTDVAVVRLHLF